MRPQPSLLALFFTECLFTSLMSLRPSLCQPRASPISGPVPVVMERLGVPTYRTSAEARASPPREGWAGPSDRPTPAALSLSHGLNRDISDQPVTLGHTFCPAAPPARRFIVL